MTDRPTPSQFRCLHGMRLSLPCDTCEAEEPLVSEPKAPRKYAHNRREYAPKEAPLVSEPKTPRELAVDFWNTCEQHDGTLAKAYIAETIRRRDEQIRQQERARIGNPSPWGPRLWAEVPEYVEEALKVDRECYERTHVSKVRVREAIDKHTYSDSYGMHDSYVVDAYDLKQELGIE